MLPLRLCYCLRHPPSLSHPLKALSFSPFPTKPFCPSLKPFASTNPKTFTMSSRPSAFDALMSGARAAAKKNTLPRSSSPKKRKSLDSDSPTNTSIFHSLAPDISISQELKSVDESIGSDAAPAAKKNKIRAVTVEQTIAQFKTKMPQLKKKAGDFDPSSVAWIAPAHEGLELGIGDASIIKALSEACGRTEVQVKKQYKELGDLGLVAKSSRSSQSMMRKPDALTVIKVFNTFRLIAKESGKDSQEKKKNHIKGLLVAATDCEPQYLIRLLQTKLRIGLAEQTLLAALGQAAVYTEKHSTPPPNIQSPVEEAAKIVKQVYSVLPVYDKIVPALLSGGVWNLPKTCNFTPGVPLGPMLAKPTKGVSEIVNKFQDMEFTCEYKYDGERAQIHYMDNGSVEIYSRNAERNTGKFPDVVIAISRLKKPSIQSFVLDCELVAYDREKQKILPFQVLSTRARKNVAVSDIKVDVCIFAFDMLYLNGQPLLQEELKVRREHLYNSFAEERGLFQFATSIISNDLEEIQKFLDTAVDSSCEGLIIKTLTRDATYEPAKRSHNWLKLKKDYMDSIGDSLDLVPIAAFHGRGKRTGVYGAFLLACYDSNNEEFQSICKIGTGFSEAVLEERSVSLRSKVIPKPKPYFRYADSMNPDVWFEPTEVWEVKAADLTISPVHRAAIGIVDPDKGISLRFPRLVRVREDKTPEQSSSSEQVADMYNAQKHNHLNNQDDNEDD
ncbi:hypothetical protein I3842_13G121700 [Carya illinoinensis]|uniref:DNA ligase n=1 Tax=Carya illinoinensis TaxID=32201 RepID=A0A922ANV5_CARIL|nr:hypothetical protein I3842_13G121700 [Carya illinoinensis]